jgi:hypothetical protein
MKKQRKHYTPEEKVAILKEASAGGGAESEGNLSSAVWPWK